MVMLSTRGSPSLSSSNSTIKNEIVVGTNTNGVVELGQRCDENLVADSGLRCNEDLSRRSMSRVALRGFYSADVAFLHDLLFSIDTPPADITIIIIINIIRNKI